jgi:hypothetical protein
MKESDMAALRTDARWHAVVQYRTGTETPKNVEIYLEEIGDIHDHIERGPHWDTVEVVKIRRINHTDSPSLTLEQAVELGRRTVRKKSC